MLRSPRSTFFGGCSHRSSVFLGVVLGNVVYTVIFFLVLDTLWFFAALLASPVLTFFSDTLVGRLSGGLTES